MRHPIRTFTALALLLTALSTHVPAAAASTQTSVRPDGSAIHWTLTGEADAAEHGLILIAQGSGCQPARANPNINLIAARIEGLGVLTIEKYGVDPKDRPADPMADCPAAYFAGHTVSRRVEDALQVLGELKTKGRRSGHLVLFGGSEGGAMVSILGAKLPETDAMVILSTGTGLTLAESLPHVVPPPVAGRMRAQFEKIRANPDGTEVWGGNSFKWWADIMDRRLSDDLLKARAPILLIHGALDRPVATARATRDAFAAAGDPRLTYWELPDRDHHMKDAAGTSHMSEVLDRAVRWIERQLQ